MIRLIRDQSALISRSEALRFTFDGVEVTAHRGETVAEALMAGGILTLRHAPGDGGPRGVFCGMGLCQECVVRIGGTLIEACRVPVTEGLSVQSASPR